MVRGLDGEDHKERRRAERGLSTTTLGKFRMWQLLRSIGSLLAREWHCGSTEDAAPVRSLLLDGRGSGLLRLLRWEDCWPFSKLHLICLAKA